MFLARRRTLLAASALALLFGVAVETVSARAPDAGPGRAGLNPQPLPPRDR